MKKILLSAALLWICIPSAQAQQRITLPGFDTVSASSMVPVVQERRVRNTKRARGPLIRCKDGSIHRNKGPACRGHGGVRR
jgi:hypothetical protein